MIYWYPSFPEHPIKFGYDQITYVRQKSELESLISEIMQNEEEEFSLTENISYCKFCQYRSFCNRGEKAGEFTEEASDFSIENTFSE